ncbi:hypothetical protein NDU88_006832 [Pleurodeles waltl]|uniref:Uncharacterized protein n=1 Tax=Pleurodeles waltl TaxID=8319 RepID=A0AAV7RRD6_PLEWA|nr:hypothetical protein NDU88_006832 [Pleurodeles waltl]
MLAPSRPPPLTRGSHQCVSTDGGVNPAAGSLIRQEGPAAECHVSPGQALPLRRQLFTAAAGGPLSPPPPAAPVSPLRRPASRRRDPPS